MCRPMGRQSRSASPPDRSLPRCAAPRARVRPSEHCPRSLDAASGFAPPSELADLIRTQTSPSRFQICSSSRASSELRALFRGLSSRARCRPCSQCREGTVEFSRRTGQAWPGGAACLALACKGRACTSRGWPRPDPPRSGRRGRLSAGLVLSRPWDRVRSLCSPVHAHATQLCRSLMSTTIRCQRARASQPSRPPMHSSCVGGAERPS